MKFSKRLIKCKFLLIKMMINKIQVSYSNNMEQKLLIDQKKLDFNILFKMA